MNIKQLTEKITNQWPVKIICLTIAIFLYIFHQASLIDKKTFVVPLTIVEDGIVMHVGHYPKSVSVIVRAENSNMKLVSIDDIHATVNLNNITEKGVYNFPVQVTISEQLMTFDPFEIKIKDEYVSLEVEKKASKYVKINPMIAGEVGYGYEIESISMDPSTVLIIGPESVVNATNQINTAKINVRNAETNFTINTKYQSISDVIEVEDEGPYYATVKIVPMKMEQSYENVPIEILNLIETLCVEDENLSVSLKLSGQVSILEKNNLSKHTAQIDLSAIVVPGVYEVPIKYNIPGNLELIDKSKETITVNINIKKANVEEGQIYFDNIE